MEKDITFLSPIKLDNKKLPYWQHTINTYHRAIRGNFKHIICDDSSPEYHEKGQETLKGRGHKIYIPPANSFIGAVVNLIETVETPYFAFITDDVCLTTNEDIFTPSIEFLENNEDVCQVKIGGGCLSDGNSNRENIKFGDQFHNSHFVVNPGNPLTPIGYYNHTFWLESTNSPNIKNIFPFSYYNCIMRTSVFKDKIHPIVKSRLTPRDKTWSDYLAKINYSIGICNKINELGYPKGFEFLNNYYTAWIDLCNYIYCFDRHHLSYEQFCKTHTNKL